MGTNPRGSFKKNPKNPITLMKTLYRHRLYPKIACYLFKTIQNSLPLLILTLKICGSIIQKTIGRLFHTISFLQLLIILLKCYFLFKRNICG
jgi:hypothetical protein